MSENRSCLLVMSIFVFCVSVVMVALHFLFGIG